MTVMFTIGRVAPEGFPIAAPDFTSEPLDWLSAKINLMNTLESDRDDALAELGPLDKAEPDFTASEVAYEFAKNTATFLTADCEFAFMYAGYVYWMRRVY